MSDGSIEGLKTAIEAVRGEIHRVQSALGVAQDRCDGALALMGTLANESTNDHLIGAQARIAIIALKIEDELMAVTQVALADLEGYARSR